MLITIETLEQRCEICSKLTIMPTKRRHRRFGGFIVNFEHISHFCSSIFIVNFEQVNADWVSSEQNDPLQILSNTGFVRLFQTYICIFNERDKICKCCSCLKIMIQSYLLAGFFTVFIIKRASFKKLNFYMKLLQSSTIFKQKTSHEVSCD